jgi:hypothetical protein
MDMAEIKNRVHAIRSGAMHKNPETPYLVACLYADVLTAIAYGAKYPEYLAREALKAQPYA